MEKQIKEVLGKLIVDIANQQNACEVLAGNPACDELDRHFYIGKAEKCAQIIYQIKRIIEQ